MADELSVALLDLLRKGEGEEAGDFVRQAMQRVAQAVIETELEMLIGARRYERSEGRTNQRNGAEPRPWDTTAGTLQLTIPKLRKGSYFPALLEPRRRVDQALANVVVEAYVKGVSTRKIDDLVRQMGVEGMDKSQVSRLAKLLDDDVATFRSRPLQGPYPYLWLDATFPKVREGGRVVPMALMIAIGVSDQGERQILGLALGSQENGADWKEFLTGLVERGLSGVQLAVSDDHLGLKAAIQSVLVGTAWQRCTVHFARNCVAKVAKTAQPGVGALVRQIFAQGDRKSASELLRRTADTLSSRFPQVAQMLEEAEEEVLAHMSFPSAHWRQIRSTNGLERLNRELARRFSVVGIFPDRPALTRLGGAVLMEQNDEWAAADRRYFSQESMALLLAPEQPHPAMSPVQSEPLAISA